MDDRFSKTSFLAANDSARVRLMQELQAQLTRRLVQARDLHVAAWEVVEELRALGHDLWSFDASDDFEIWGPNYHAPTGPGLIIELYPEEASIDWYQARPA